MTTESQAGLAVGQAPVKVAVADGRVASADVELVAVASAVLQEPARRAAPPQDPPRRRRPRGRSPAGSAGARGARLGRRPGTGAQIQFEPVTCFVAGEFPLLDTGIEPVASVARARVYFKGAVGDAFYYVEMSLDQGRYFGKLPRPRVEATPITYYVQSTTTEFEESQTREIEALVVQDKAECGDRKVAAIGPAGAVTVFSAATGRVDRRSCGLRRGRGLGPRGRCDHRDRGAARPPPASWAAWWWRPGRRGSARPRRRSSSIPRRSRHRLRCPCRRPPDHDVPLGIVGGCRRRGLPPGQRVLRVSFLGAVSVASATHAVVPSRQVPVVSPTSTRC